MSSMEWEYRCVQTRGVYLSLGLTLTVSIKKFKCSLLIYVRCRGFYVAMGNSAKRRLNVLFAPFTSMCCSSAATYLA